MSQMTDLLERDRKRFGFTVGQAAYRQGVTPVQYQALLEDPAPMTFETWERICGLYGWPPNGSPGPRGPSSRDIPERSHTAGRCPGAALSPRRFEKLFKPGPDHSRSWRRPMLATNGPMNLRTPCA